MRVLLAGGGTAGHVNPLLAVAEGLRASDPDAQLLALGTREGLERSLVPAAGLALEFVPRVPLPRRLSASLFSVPSRLRSAVQAARRAIDLVDAQVVVGFGGYVSTPAYLAARQSRVPVVIHEQNARPGLANRLGARWARAVALTFPDTPLRATRPGAVTEVTGMPLRGTVAQLAADAPGSEPRRRARDAARERLELTPDLPCVLVTGGSLGAASINQATVAAAEELTTMAQVLHITGKGKADSAHEARSHLTRPERYHVREYLDPMADGYAAADLLVCRAGAGTVCEAGALGLPAIYVPLPIGNGEQARNAHALVAAGGGLLVDDHALDAARLVSEVRAIVTEPARREQMAQAARAASHADGTARVVALIQEAVG